ncbi:MAG: aldolase catalytic domain-containing protein [Nibricoccus sp.]
MSKEASTHATGNKGWVGYRPEIKVLDCTVRDGGLMNDHNFPLEFVQAVYAADCAAGVDYMEMGYKGMASMYPSSKYGLWKFCTEENMRKVVGEKKGPTKISVMADAERTVLADILPREKSVVDLIRVATYIHQIPSALEIVNDAHKKGYETALNIMAVSTVPESELESALEIIVQSPVNTLYVVDSFGTLYSEQIRGLVQRFQKYTLPTKKELGIHTHNNLQLAFANTIEAIVLGCNYVDASIAGLGRGAGNCPLELALSFLHNPKFKMRPVLEAIQNTVEPYREELRWGFAIPYMLTGYLNQHPKAAMQFMEGDDFRNIVKFYDEAVQQP